jgi:hypothetical protein
MGMHWLVQEAPWPLYTSTTRPQTGATGTQERYKGYGADPGARAMRGPTAGASQAGPGRSQTGPGRHGAGLKHETGQCGRPGHGPGPVPGPRQARPRAALQVQAATAAASSAAPAGGAARAARERGGGLGVADGRVLAAGVAAVLLVVGGPAADMGPVEVEERGAVAVAEQKLSAVNCARGRRVMNTSLLSHAHACARACRHARTQTRTHKHARTRTHARTHAQPPGFGPPDPLVQILSALSPAPGDPRHRLGPGTSRATRTCSRAASLAAISLRY